MLFPPASTLTERSAGSLEVHLLGVVDFDAALFLQERLAYELSGRDDGQGALLLCEHPPLITIGRQGSEEDILVGPSELTARLIDVRRVSRGGGCIAHAPGQLAVYPVLPLDRLGLGLAEFRERLQAAVLAACREARLAAWPSAAGAGLWCRTGQFAHFGAAVRSWVTMHGMFVNINPCAEFLRLARPWPADGPVTSISAARLRKVSMHALRESLVRHLAARLGYDQTHVYTGHPLLRRTRRSVYVPA